MYYIKITNETEKEFKELLNYYWGTNTYDIGKYAVINTFDGSSNINDVSSVPPAPYKEIKDLEEFKLLYDLLCKEKYKHV